MIRRQTRQRREYLYRKAQESQEKQIWERKQKIKAALAAGKPIPTELREYVDEVAGTLKYDETQEDPAIASTIDDEYGRAGEEDPKVLITTSRDPSSKLLQFSKEIRLVIPNAQRINRGGYVVKELAAACRANEVTDLVILHETRGVPDALVISHFPHGPTASFSLHNVILRHDVAPPETVSEQYPHLIFDNFTTPLGKRTSNILKYLFPVPKADSKRLMTFANESDFIHFRHHIYLRQGRQINLQEIGPRFSLRLYEVRQGTVEQVEADKEWVLSSYTRTARKRTHL